MLRLWWFHVPLAGGWGILRLICRRIRRAGRREERLGKFKRLADFHEWDDLLAGEGRSLEERLQVGKLRLCKCGNV
jgi:hypothetical protein